MVSLNPPNPPAGFLGYFFWSFESGVLAAFPPSTPASRLSSWMDREGFRPVEYSVYDTGNADQTDKEDERKRLQERKATGMKIRNRHKNIENWCGLSSFSIGWNSDDCGNLTEVYADRSLCRLEFP